MERSLQPRGALKASEEIGRYRLIEAIGRGGMATVFAAEHAALRRSVAVKVLHSHLTFDQGMARRIVREARTIAALRHPGIVEVFDVGITVDGRTYLVMELLKGESLADRLAQGALTEERAVVFARQLASALEAAHAAGVIHRDLKPENVFIVPDTDVPGGERVKLLDFGIAKGGDESPEKTKSGVVLGTPSYMAPEQIERGRIDARVDVYALGVILYRMVTGALPFGGANTDEIFAEHAHIEPAPAASIAPVSKELSRIITWCLAKRPEQRCASMRELGAALDAHLTSLLAHAIFEEEEENATTQVEVVRAAPAPKLETVTTLRTPKVAPAPRWLIAILIVCIAVVGVSIVMLVRSRARREVAVSEPTPFVPSEAPKAPSRGTEVAMPPIVVTEISAPPPARPRPRARVKAANTPPPAPKPQPAPTPPPPKEKTFATVEPPTLY